MFEWEGRILDNKSIQLMKAALPYLDIPVGDVIDLEGLLRAVRNFCHQKEQKIIDMLLGLFMMKRVMSIMNVMNQMNQMDPMGEAGNAGQSMNGMQSMDTMQSMNSMLDILKSQMPKEQQEMFDMVSVMMSAMADGTAEPDGEEKGDDGSGEDFQEYASGEGSGNPGTGAEGEREGYEETGAADHGSDAEIEDSQPFVFPAGGFGPFRNLDKGHEPDGEAEGGNDETDGEE